MNITHAPERITFESGGCVAGEYVLDTPYKPFFRTLRTPAGHNCTLVSPADHRHHRGLMYALKTEEVNFWEEDPGTGQCGVQEILSTDLMEDGFRQTLLWREEQGGFHTYNETRTITCTPKGNGFEWSWHTKRVSLRDHRLIVSGWLLELEDGSKVNYHGLGVRLPWVWVWGGPKGDPGHFGTIEVNGAPASQNQASGSTVASVGLVGLIDGFWDPPRAAVTITQEQEFGWFALREGFPYLSVGPSILGDLDVAEGTETEETYRIFVEDRP